MGSGFAAECDGEWVVGGLVGWDFVRSRNSGRWATGLRCGDTALAWRERSRRLLFSFNLCMDSFHYSYFFFNSNLVTN